MKLSAEKLDSHLQSKLAPVYLITGDEPLQREEAADAVRAAAHRCGYTEREVMFAERGFDWNRLASLGASLSLFAAKRVLEIRLPTGKPGDAGAAAFNEYANNPATDAVLLVISAKLERGGGRWAEALEQVGVHVSIWPVEMKSLPAWIGRRMQKLGMRPTPEAVSLIAERVEGNLLAAAQEVEKLLLLNGQGQVDSASVREAVADSARYDPYTLVDAALAGDLRRATRILMGLEEEGTEPAFIQWALAREIRNLAVLACEIESGIPAHRVLAGVWEKRRAIVQKALERHERAEWRRLLCLSAHSERVIKGQAAGRPWDELLNLSVKLAGLKPPGSGHSNSRERHHRA